MSERMPGSAPGPVPVQSPASRRERAVPECHGDVCITCSDEAVPVRVVRLLDAGLAMVDTGVSVEEVSIALVDAGVGDVVLVHAKEAIAVVDGEAPVAEEADATGAGGERAETGGEVQP
ncbi:MAG: HypC/HybG/HupF family hydrogenase formation chaperone [Actinomycetes bacterium]